MQNVEVPWIFCYFLLGDYYVYPFMLFSVFLDVGAQSYWSVKMDQNDKIWPLTSIFSLRQQDPKNIVVEYASG